MTLKKLILKINTLGVCMEKVRFFAKNFFGVPLKLARIYTFCSFL